MYLWCLVLLVYLRAFAGASSGSSDWCYHGCENSPSHWESLPGAFCGGQRQSPVDIVTSHVRSNADLRDFAFVNWTNQHVIKSVSNTGHTVKCVLEAGAVEVKGGGLGGTYSALQFHLHWGDSEFHPGSEHTVNGHRYPMEMHIVSVKKGLTVDQALADPGGLAVLGFFINGSGTTSQPWADLTSYLVNLTEKESTVNVPDSANISISDLLGNVNLTKFYRYNGSLTTPTCNEAVVWTVFQEPIQITRELIELFPNKTGLTNVFRPPQYLNRRHVQASPAIPTSPGPSGHDWCYDGSSYDCHYKPSLWSELNSRCGGKSQSPINIDTSRAEEDSRLVEFTYTKFDDQNTMAYLINTGHAVKCVLKDDMVSVSGGGLGHEYKTLQFHFHWADTSDHPEGSEHTVDSKRYPMVMHIVNMRSDLTVEQAKNTSNGFAVLAFFIEAKGTHSSGSTGDHSTDHHKAHSSDGWTKLTSYLSDIRNIGSLINVTKEISMDDLLGDVDRTEYFRYNGSLTTPTCDEAVVWTVFKHPVKVDMSLLKMFPSNAGYINVYRPQQALNGRTVYTTAGCWTAGPLSALLLAGLACLYVLSV